MKTSRIAAAVLVALLSSSIPHLAAAQDDPVTVQARVRFKEGVDHYDKGQFEHARLAFLQAYALKKHPAVLLNLAQSSAKAGHTLEASKYFQQFLKESTGATPQQRSDAEAGLADVRHKIGRIEIAAPAGTEVTLDEKERIGTAPFAEPIDVEPGSHSLRSPTETVRVTANAGQKVHARFAAGGQPGASPPVVPVPAPAPATATDTTTPPAGASSAAETATPAAGEPAAKRKSLLAPPANMTPVYIGAVAAGVGLVGTILFAAFKADAQSKANSVAGEIRSAAIKRSYDGDKNGIPDGKGVCSDTDPTIHDAFGNACATLKSNNDKVDTNATLANVSVVIMIAGAATAAGWYLFAPKREDHGTNLPSTSSVKRHSPVLVPYAGYGSGGLVLSGSF